MDKPTYHVYTMYMHQMIYHVYTMYIPCIYLVDVHGISKDIPWYIQGYIHGITKDIPCIFHVYVGHLHIRGIYQAYSRHIPKIGVPDGHGHVLPCTLAVMDNGFRLGKNVRTLTYSPVYVLFNFFRLCLPVVRAATVRTQAGH
jgi:hypothetical protein